jgi:hypothetical protein
MVVAKNRIHHEGHEEHEGVVRKIFVSFVLFVVKTIPRIFH